jgi:hypothetical protein
LCWWNKYDSFGLVIGLPDGNNNFPVEIKVNVAVDPNKFPDIALILAFAIVAKLTTANIYICSNTLI